MDAPAAAAEAAIEYKRSGPCVGIVYDERMLLHSVHSGAGSGGASSSGGGGGRGGGGDDSDSAAVNVSGASAARNDTAAATGATTPVAQHDAAALDESSPGADPDDADDAASVDSEFPYGHPECPQRIVSIFEAIKNAGLLKECRLVQAEPISYDLIATVHDAEYIRHMKENDGRDRDELEKELEDNKCTFGTEFHEHDPGDWNGGSVCVSERERDAWRSRRIRFVCRPQ
jgi:hypothetical protein